MGTFLSSPRLNQGASTQPPDSAALGSATTAGFPATPVTSGGINRRSRWTAREMYLWCRFQRMTRTNQEVLSTVGLACLLDDRSLHGPCTRMTVCTWLKKRADFLHLPFAGYEPKPSLAWVCGAVMERRRRQHHETADQRLDRLIEMERRSKLEVPQVPEVRRLKVTEGDVAASTPEPRRDEGRGQGGTEGPQGHVTSLQLDAEPLGPDGLLAPLFHESGQDEAQTVFRRRLDEDDDIRPAVAAERGLHGGPSAAGAGLELARNLSSDAGREQGFVHRDGTSLLVASTGLFGQERGGAGVMAVPPGVNAFWSAGVQRAAVLEQVADVARPESLPPLAGAPVTFGPAGYGVAGHGHSGASPGQACGAGALHGGPVQACGAGALHGGPVQACGAGALHGGPGQARGAGALHGGPEQAQGTLNGAGPVKALAIGMLSQPSPEKSVEELRLRIMKEAEESFVREAKKLRGEEGEGGEIRSYHTASSGAGATTGSVPPMPALQGSATTPSLAMHPAGHLAPSHLAERGQVGLDGHQHGAQGVGQGCGLTWSQPVSPMAVHSPGIPGGQSPGLHGRAGASYCGLHAGGLCGGMGSTANSQGYAAGPHGGGQFTGDWNASGPMASFGGGGTSGTTSVVRPPGLGGPDQQQGAVSPMEQLRGSDLPLLPQPGSEQSALQFGDWITVVTPMIGDVAGSARGWWSEILREASNLYDRWLTSTPLERIRLRPLEIQRSEAHLRLEQRVVPMLLKCIPELIKQDLIASRTMTVTGIMYRLWTIFQPGGSSERVSILKQLTEPRVAAGAPDLLGGLRRWRRLMSRSLELNLALPDPVILGGVLHRFADALGKLGGTQLAYRVASVRQELGVDIRPMAPSIEQYAEYLQSEAEELSLGIGLKATTVGAQGATSLKAMAGLDVPTSTMSVPTGTTLKSPCKFWKTPEGCKRGAQCTFLHETSDMKGRCFNCGSSAHLRKDCTAKTSSTSTSTSTPSAGPMGDGLQPKKVSKVKATPKPAVKGSAGDSQKLKTAGGDELKPKEVTNTASGGASEETQGGDSTTTEPMGEPSTEAAAELMREATSLLKSIRSLKAVRMKSVGEGNFGGPGEYALLDGGATHGLRQAKPEEEPDLIATKVELACGSTVLYKHPKHQTLLSKGPVEPIIPLAWLVAADYRITWRRDSIVIHHPTRGPLKCSLRGGCPVMPRTEGLDLLADLGKMQQNDVEVREDELNWWANRFPQVPSSVWKFMKGQGDSWRDHAASLPWNRHRRRRLWRSRGVILHLFSGRNFKQWAELEQEGYVVLTIDTLQGVDLHEASIWAFIWELACAGKIAAILGGPPCRTTSRLRQRQPGPPPLRGRDGWRFSLEGLSTWDLHRVNSDTALLFKQIGLFIKAEEKRMQVPELQSLPTAFALESPEDPMAYLGAEAAHNLPSFWNFPEMKEMVGLGGLKLVSFDQSQMGHARRKPTTILGNLPGVEQLDGLRDSSRRTDPLPKGLQESMEASRDWASWAPGLVMALKEALRAYLHQRSQCLAQRIHKLNVEEWKQHVRAHHHPYRRDCRRCMELAGVDSPHRRSHADSSAYVLSMDLVGPYPVGRDDGRRRKGKYILVATVLCQCWTVSTCRKRQRRLRRTWITAWMVMQAANMGLNLHYNLMKEINLRLININHNQRKECLWKRWTRSSRWRW